MGPYYRLFANIAIYTRFRRFIWVWEPNNMVLDSLEHGLSENDNHLIN